MKREILFKAQRADGKGWIEGLPTIFPSGKAFIQVYHNRGFIKLFDVIPETLCQFTSREIEGTVKLFNGDTFLSNGKCHVYWNNEKSSYYVKEWDGTYVDYGVSEEDTPLSDYDLKYCVFTGNIHDTTQH